MMRRTLLFTAVAVGSWWAAATYLEWRRLPSFVGADASGTFGDSTLPHLSMAVLGDSSCTGPGLERIEDVWVQRVGRALGERFHVTMDSYAVGGSKAADVLSSQVPQATNGHHYDMTIVSVGANDMLYGVTVSTFRQQLRAVVDALAPASDAIVLSGVGDMGSIPRLPALLRWPARARGLAADRAHATVATDRPNVFKVPLWSRAEEFRHDLSLWAPDLFHASAAGHALYADAALPTVNAAIDEILKGRRSENPTTH